VTLLFSASRKCAFIHIPKSGGTSIKAALGLATSPIAHGLRLYRHATAGTLKHGIEQSRRWADYYSFAFVRNPWDRAASASRNFGREVDQVIELGLMRPQVDYVNDANGQRLVTFVGRFETLQTDWLTVCDAIGISAALPCLNQTSDDVSYRSCYTDRSRALIAARYCDDIVAFGYSF
jgi:chondroitin 4-sulfotransferase 11